MSKAQYGRACGIESWKVSVTPAPQVVAWPPTLAGGRAVRSGQRTTAVAIWRHGTPCPEGCGEGVMSVGCVGLGDGVTFGGCVGLRVGVAFGLGVLPLSVHFTLNSALFDSATILGPSWMRICTQ